jgi:hypothetical protein
MASTLHRARPERGPQMNISLPIRIHTHRNSPRAERTLTVSQRTEP